MNSFRKKYKYGHTHTHTHAQLTRKVYPNRLPQFFVVLGPVVVLNIASGGHCLHPLRVVVDQFPRGSGPFLAQATHDQGLILHCGPLTLETLGREGVDEGVSVGKGVREEMVCVCNGQGV